MTDKEKILAEIERLMKWKPKAIPSGMRQRDVLNIRKSVLLTLKDFINSLPTEQPNKDLEEEINDYFERHFEICNDNTIKCGGEEFGTYELLDVIEHFTNWQKEQMMKSAVSIGYLQDWYQNSIDGEVPPIWTDEHLNELTKDFYLIPKQKEDEQ